MARTVIDKHVIGKPLLKLWKYNLRDYTPYKVKNTRIVKHDNKFDYVHLTVEPQNPEVGCEKEIVMSLVAFEQKPQRAFLYMWDEGVFELNKEETQYILPDKMVETL